MKKIILLFLMISSLAFAQKSYTIQGHFPTFPNSSYELKGYDGVQQSTIATAKSDTEGKFLLTYPENYIGNAQLFMNGAYQNLFLLNKENITIFWGDLTQRDAMQISNSKEYDAFLGGMKTFQESEAKLAGLNYLVPLYAKDSIKQMVFAKELDFVANSFPTYIKALPENLYARQYLLAKGLIEQMPKTVETYKWRAPAHVAEFMAIDFKVLKHSGLYKELILGYTSLVERFPLEDINLLFETAIDKVILELRDEPKLLEDITQQWFALLEQKSLFASAEYLALKMLNQDNCVLEDKSKDRFEQYRKLAVGKTAPVLTFTQKKWKGKTLKDVKGKYKVLVFGASWCEACKTELKQLAEYTSTFKKKYNTEIVFISMDTDEEAYANYVKDFSFITDCDFKGWEGENVKNYYVFASPTLLILDAKNKIMAKPATTAAAVNWLSVNK